MRLCINCTSIKCELIITSPDEASGSAPLSSTCVTSDFILPNIEVGATLVVFPALHRCHSSKWADRPRSQLAWALSLCVISIIQVITRALRGWKTAQNPWCWERKAVHFFSRSIGQIFHRLEGLSKFLWNTVWTNKQWRNTKSSPPSPARKRVGALWQCSL